jgi:hypothetical protein
MEKAHHGSCACGKVKFEATLDLAKGASRCNCTLCLKLNQSSVIVRPDAFRIVSGERHLRRYQRHAAYAMFRHFCGECGTQVYGTGNLPELGGDFASVNVQCLDGVEVGDVAIRYWDGRHDNWQAGLRDRPWPILRAEA